MRKPKQYQTVTANLNGDGSLSIVAWKNNREFDMIPLSDGKGGEIKRVAPITPLTEAAPDMLAMLEKLVLHVMHYASMPHAHSEAYKDVADARAIIKQATA